MKIQIGKTPSPTRKLNKVYNIEGFEVWRKGKTWHALKWPRAMEANTKKAIVRMISENAPAVKTGRKVLT